MSPMRGEVMSFTDSFAVRVFPSNPYEQRIKVLVRVYDQDFYPVAARVTPAVFTLAGNGSRSVLVIVPFEGDAQRKVRICTESVPFPNEQTQIRAQICGKFLGQGDPDIGGAWRVAVRIRGAIGRHLPTQPKSERLRPARVTLPQGQDEVRAADGTTCSSAISGSGAYLDIGVIKATACWTAAISPPTAASSFPIGRTQDQLDLRAALRTRGAAPADGPRGAQDGRFAWRRWGSPGSTTRTAAANPETEAQPFSTVEPPQGRQQRPDDIRSSRMLASAGRLNRCACAAVIAGLARSPCRRTPAQVCTDRRLHGCMVDTCGTMSPVNPALAISASHKQPRRLRKRPVRRRPTRFATATSSSCLDSFTLSAPAPAGFLSGPCGIDASLSMATTYRINGACRDTWRHADRRRGQIRDHAGRPDRDQSRGLLPSRHLDGAGDGALRVARLARRRTTGCRRQRRRHMPGSGHGRDHRHQAPPSIST